MVRVPGWTGLIALLMVLGGCAASVPHEIDASSIRPLVEFVERETGYTFDPLPGIAAVPRDKLKIVSSGALAAPKYFQAAYQVVKWRHGNGWVYAGMVWLDIKDFSLNDPYQRSAIVHELVHHGQTLAMHSAGLVVGGRAYHYLLDRKSWSCANSLEAEAYEVQNRYLAKEAPHKMVSQKHIDESSRCEPAAAAPNVLHEQAQDVTEEIERWRSKSPQVEPAGIH